MKNLVENDICSVTEEDFYPSVEGIDIYAINDEEYDDEDYFKSLYSINGKPIPSIDETTEEDDVGCFVGCMLADTLQEVISSLVGGYAVLQNHIENEANPNEKIINSIEKRRKEIRELKNNYFNKPDNKYSTIRRWISTYSEELKELNNLRDQYGC